MGGHFYSVVFAAAVLVMPSLGVPSLTLSWTGSETVTIPRMVRLLLCRRSAEKTGRGETDRRQV